MDSNLYKIAFKQEKNPYYRDKIANLGDYFFATNRGKFEEICYVLKIENFSKNVPQVVNGVALDLKTGDIIKTSDDDFYAYQIKGSVSDDQLKKIKKYFMDRINNF